MHSKGKVLKTLPMRVSRRIFSWIIDRFGKHLESFFQHKVGGNIQGPVFIIGPPRSGTTLLYQILIAQFDLAFLTNLHNRYPTCPFFITSLLRRRLNKASHDNFESNYGRVNGVTSPSEAGAFWYRWFPKAPDLYSPSGSLDKKTLDSITQTVLGLQSSLGKTVVFKNTYNSMRIGSIVEALPNVVFIVCKRNLINNATSILVGRKKHMGNEDSWMGVAPREFPRIKLNSSPSQCVDQVACIHKQIDSDRLVIGKEKFFEVDYNELCMNPRLIMRQISKFLKSNGIPVVEKRAIPEEFPQPIKSPVSDAARAEIEKRSLQWMKSEDLYEE